MRKTISILLISLVLFNSFGFIFVYYQIGYYMKHSVLNQIQDYIPDNKLTVIAFNKSDNKSISDFVLLNDEEIKYANKMYDIYKVVETKDSLKYICIFDENESILELVYNYFLQNNENIKYSSLHNILSNIILIASFPLEYNFYIEYNFNGLITSVSNKLLYVNLDTLKPPPKSFS